MNEESADRYTSRTEAILSPIPGDDPGGDDLRAGDDLQSLDAMAHRVLHGTETDKDEVAALAEEFITSAESLLVQKSKHLKVIAQWLSVIEASGDVREFLFGINTLQRFLVELWDHAWPREMSKRARIFVFLNQGMASRVGNLKCEQDHVPILLECWAGIRAIEGSLQSRTWPEDSLPPSFRELRSAIEKRVEDLTGSAFKAPDQEKEAAPQEAPAGTEETGAPSPPASGLEEEEPAEEVLRSEAPAEGREDEQVRRLLSDIPGAHPAGVDPRRSDDPNHPYAQAQELFNLLAEGRSTPDAGWPQLAENCAITLREHAKDLFAASWLAIAWYHTDGYQGLCSGIRVLEGLLTRYGSGCFPQRPRARANAIQLLNSRLSEYVANVPAQDPDPTILQEAADSLSRIPALIGQLLREDAPPVSLRLLSEALAKRISEVTPPAGVEKTEEKPAEPTQIRPQPVEERREAAVPKEAPTLSVPAGEGVSPAAFHDTLVQFARQWREFDATSPLPYRLLRIGVWGKLTNLPNAPDGVFPLEIDKNRRNVLASLDKSSNWDGMLKTSESWFSEDGPQRYWLDLQRLSHTALCNLGEDYRGAADAVAVETGLFLRRLPGIERLVFKDGQTRFADAETMEWIANKVNPLLGDGGGPSGEATVEKEALQPVEDAFTEGELPQALDCFYAWYRSQAPGKSKIAGVLKAADHLRSRGQVRLARAILLSLDKELITQNAETWVPDFCMHVWAELCRCNRDLQAASRQNRDEKTAEALEAHNRELLTRMARLDWKKTGLVSESSS